ncbi:MAG: hypothetical protein ACYDEX_16125 [Mobilitalea sp.]
MPRSHNIIKITAIVHNMFLTSFFYDSNIKITISCPKLY